MFFFKRFKTLNSNDECLDKILSIFSDCENEMMNGKYNLCLTVEFLMFYDDLNRNLNNEICEEILKKKYQSKVDSLRNSFKNLTFLKVTGNLKESFKLKFDLKYFANLKKLELENVYIDNILNFNELKSQLTAIKLNRCLSNKSFEEFFVRSGGDAWSSLNSLSINRATFKNDDFNFVPISTSSLQLQWNQIKRFNLNSSTIQNLTELDLSFNKLKHIPNFKEKEVVYKTLKVLKLKGNLINSLKNIENLEKLENLDLSMNLIYNKDEISRYLSFCKQLKILNLIDNPVQILDNLNVHILEIFPTIRKFNNHLYFNNTPNDKESTSSNANLVSDFEEENKNSTVSSSRNDELNLLKTSSTKKKDRIAVILDRTNSNLNIEDEQSDQDRISFLSSTTKGLSLGLENNHPDLKEIIAEQRKSLGKKLLIKSIAPSSLVESCSTPVDCTANFSIIGEIHKLQNSDGTKIDSVSRAEIEKLKDKIKDPEPNKDEDETSQIKKDHNLNDNLSDKPRENLENNQLTDSFTSTSLSPKEEDNLWTKEDTEEDDNIFLVNKFDSNSVESTDPIFIAIKDSLIYEKDCATGKIFEVFDLKIITNYQLENNSTISLIFDSKVKSKQKVTYNLEWDRQLDKFIKQFIGPYVARNQEEKLNQRFKYECLKCGSKNSQQTECSNCKSTALIESTNYNKQLNQIDKQAYATQSSFKEEFLNQIKIKLTNDQVMQNSDQNENASTSGQLKETYSLNNEKLIEKEINEKTVIKKQKKEFKNNKDDEENDEEVKNLINLKLENYNLEQFTSVDHELKLYLDFKIFTSNERLKHLFECDFSLNDSSEMSHGRILTTNTSLHLVSFKYETIINDSMAQFETFTMPLNKIKNIKLSRDYFFHQCIWLTVEKLSGKKKKKKHLIEIQTFFIILKDKKLVDLFCDYLENYLNKHEIKLKTNVNAYSLSEKPVKLDTEENIIFSQFIVSLTTKSDMEISKSKSNDLLCLLFEKGAEIILARIEVIANELKFKKICRNDLSNLVCAKLDPNNCQELHLYFSKDSNCSNIEWIIGSYSVNSMSKIIDLVQTIWQSIYKVNLQIFMN